MDPLQKYFYKNEYKLTVHQDIQIVAHTLNDL